MSGLNAANAIQKTNPPLDYNKKAIREHLQFHATNGPAYVQIQATKALARMIGLYDDAKNGSTNAVDNIKEKGKSPPRTDGGDQKRHPQGHATTESRRLLLLTASDDSEDDEEEGGTDEAEPP